VIALAVLLVAIAPQLPRLLRFYETLVPGIELPTMSLGNLEAPVSFWKAFGVWDTADYRLPANNAALVGVGVGFVAIVTLAGATWWLRRRGWVLPLAAAVAIGVWIYSDSSESPYVASKGLVVLTPLIMLLATRWLVEPRPGASSLAAMRILPLCAATLLGSAVLTTSVRALRSAYVGPTDHVNELRALRPTLGRARTLFLGWDDFIRWELAGTPVDEPFLGYPPAHLRAGKHSVPGQTLDFDDIPAEALDQYRYVVGPRDPAGSQPPSNMRLVRSSRFYAVWERDGPTPHREILNEREEPGVVVDCATPAGRAIAGQHGVAAVRAPNVVTPVPSQGPGTTVRVSAGLSPGRWWLSTTYTSPQPVEVTAPGLRATLPANLDRPGNRWLIGEVSVKAAAPTLVSFRVRSPALAGPLPTDVETLVAAPQTPIRVVPLGRTCGQDVDWYKAT
jgi:hypothetical protein